MQTKKVNHQPDDTAYLKRVAKLSFDNRKWTRKSIGEMRDFLGVWNHNIKLPFGIYTAYCEGYYPAHREIVAILNHQLNGAFRGQRILDVGCLEGYFSAECALQGAQVVAIDGKIVNVKKCEFIKSVLGLGSLTVAKDDAMRITRKKYGSFEVVLALGLLYHLEDPFTFLANMANLCDNFLLLDTHIALEEQPESIKDGWTPELSPLRDFTANKKTYTGRLYREFNPRTSQVTKDLSTTASLTNDLSIWLTEPSLISLLRDVGFEQISQLLYPKEESNWWSDPQGDARVLFLAVKKRQPFRSMIFPGR
jgi:2-polyprenyl-3-methyl-5-hydroxy-6-metoxy-1,4-benzoquinol methylase